MVYSDLESDVYKIYPDALMFENNKMFLATRLLAREVYLHTSADVIFPRNSGNL